MPCGLLGFLIQTCSKGSIIHYRFLCSLCKCSCVKARHFLPTAWNLSFLLVLSHKIGFCLPVRFKPQDHDMFFSQQWLFIASRAISSASQDNSPMLKGFFIAGTALRIWIFWRLSKQREFLKRFLNIRMDILTKICVFVFIDAHYHFYAKYPIRNII